MRVGEPSFCSRRIARFAIFLFMLLQAIAFTTAQAELKSLRPDDPLYQQHQDLIAEYRQANAQNRPPPPLSILSYTPREEDTLFSISARLTLPYSTIATLNRMHSPELPAGSSILVPTQPGLFVYRDTRSDMDQVLSTRLADDSRGHLLHLDPEPGRDGPSVEVVFFPGQDFTPAERNRFLRPTFLDPLPEGVISSRYGYRIHPMLGRRVFHRGVDLTAAFGTPVLSAAHGVVTGVKRDPMFGLSVRIDHSDGYATVYAHLREVFVAENDTVSGGQTIGAVGSTGLSTGPHLHFEILRDERHRDPERYIR
jgi:murein DD-endopeptidase MepM/ murein hydrolase activator NlpD